MFNLTLQKSLIFIILPLIGLFGNSAWAKSSVWKVSKGNDYIYVGGTVHMLPPSAFPLPAEFEKAYKDSDSIVLETQLPDANDVEFQLQMMQEMSYLNGETINQHLSKTTQVALKEYVSSLGVDIALFQQFKPGFLVTMLALLEAQKAGVSGEGVDPYFSQKAQSDNKEIAYFESVEFQMAMISNLGLGYEDKFIQSNLKQMKSFNKLFTGILSAWRAGDEAKLVKLAIKPMQDDPKTYQSMLVNRNKNWEKDIHSMFTDKDREFVLVGVAHLVGKDSLLKLLERKGYKVQSL